jgi:hypothetical protein
MADDKTEGTRAEVIGPDSKKYVLSTGLTISGGSKGLKSLKSLHLGYTMIIDHDVKMIGTLCGENLVSLDLSGCTRLTPTGIQFLEKLCPKLECLYIYE